MRYLEEDRWTTDRVHGWLAAALECPVVDIRITSDGPYKWTAKRSQDIYTVFMPDGEDQPILQPDVGRS